MVLIFLISNPRSSLLQGVLKLLTRSAQGMYGAEKRDNQTKHRERKHFCMYCLQCFRHGKAVINHKENCITINGAQAIQMPKADDMVYFKNYYKGPAAPFVIYADFQAVHEKV